MCVICNKQYKVLSISLIPGLDDVSTESFYMFFPWIGTIPVVGSLLTEDQIAEQNN